MVRGVKSIHHARAERRRGRRVVSISEILADPRCPDTTRAESDFDALQARYPKRPEYGYDLSSLFDRAAARSASILRQANAGDARLKLVEIGAGDGMLGALLAAAGHDVTLCDLQDWRTESAKQLHFVAADCCVAIPLDTGEFDIVCSFNSFEHFGDPQQAFHEALRITKAGGLMYFEFGPLYCSPWGLHAYRSFRMPYPQFLFSEKFIEAKLGELGIWDLGQKRTELQVLNKWRATQFRELWAGSGREVVNCQVYTDDSHLDLMELYPESFRGRGLSYEDAIGSSLSVTIRKR
jgi:SAM-dependent methyltransferase